MKNLKMGLFGLLAILAVSVFLTSCEQEIVETPVVSEMDRIQQLELDPNFIEINKLNAKLLEEVTHAMVTKGITGEDLKNIYMNQDTDALIDFMEDTEIETIMDKITPIDQQLSADYSDLVSSNQDLAINLEEGFNQLELMTNIENRGCGWSYWGCVAGASAAAAVCTAGTSGIGAFFCALARAAAIAVCRDRYCD